MDSLNNIPSQGSFGNIVSALNANFDTIRVAIGLVEYSTTRCKGMYASSEALGLAVPSPKVGDWALVGQSLTQANPSAIYVCNTAGTWANSGNSFYGDNVNLTNYVTQSEFTTHKNAYGARITTLENYFEVPAGEDALPRGIVHTHKVEISQLYTGVSNLNTANGRRITEINALQNDLNTPNTGLKAKMSWAEGAIDELYTGVGNHNTSLGVHNVAIQNLQGDVAYLRAAISMIDGSGGGTGLSIQAMTQEAYDDLEEKDATTLYIII